MKRLVQQCGLQSVNVQISDQCGVSCTVLTGQLFSEAFWPIQNVALAVARRSDWLFR